MTPKQLAAANEKASPWRWTLSHLQDRIAKLGEAPARTIREDECLEELGLVETGTDYRTYVAGTMPEGLRA